MKRKNLIITACILFVVLAAGSLFTLKHYQDSHYIYIHNARYSRAETYLSLNGRTEPDLASVMQLKSLLQLDLRGTQISAADYETVQAALPECYILWDIPFQGSFYDIRTEKLTVTELSDTDIDALAYFGQLQEIDALGCTDYDSIFALQNRYPNCAVSYQVGVGGQAYREDTAFLSAENADTAELELALERLPQLQSVHLTGTLPDISWLTHMTQTYPGVTITWDYTILDHVFRSDATEIDLSDIPMENADEVEAALPYFPALTKVVMCNCGISNEDMDALNKRHEDVKFVWSILVAGYPVRTDVTALMPWQFCYGVFDSDCKDLKYCTDIICLDMGHQRITDVSFLYYMPNMQYLMLADTLVTDATPIGTLKELKYLELFFSGITDVSPLANCTKLEDINLSWMTVLNIETLKDLPNVQRFWLNNTDCPKESIYVLMQAMPNTTFCVVEGGDSVGFGWRKSPNYYAQRDLLGMFYMDQDT